MNSIIEQDKLNSAESKAAICFLFSESNKQMNIFQQKILRDKCFKFKKCLLVLAIVFVAIKFVL